MHLERDLCYGVCSLAGATRPEMDSVVKRVEICSMHVRALCIAAAAMTRHRRGWKGKGGPGRGGEKTPRAAARARTRARDCANVL